MHPALLSGRNASDFGIHLIDVNVVKPKTAYKVQTPGSYPHAQAWEVAQATGLLEL
jgi:hypothetical protein